MRDFRLFLTLSALVLCCATISADDICDQMYNSAVSKYNNKDYEDALRTFRIIEKGRCSSYYNVSPWIKRCNDAIKKKNEPKKQTETESSSPKNKTEKPAKNQKTYSLSVSDTAIIAEYTDTVISMPVKAKGEWSVQLASGYWYNATKSNDSLVVYIDRNPYDTSREDIFEIRSENDSTKYITFTISQKPAEKLLEVAYTKLEDSGSGGDRTIDVNCTVKNWRIEYAPEWTKCHKVNENKALSIHVEENMQLTARQDSIVLKAGDLRKTITIDQQTLAPSKETIDKMKATINSVTFRDNMYSNGAMGVAININMHLENMKGNKTKCIVKFADADHVLLKTTQPTNYKDEAGNIIALQQFHPARDSYDEKDFPIHMPYRELRTEGLISCQVVLQEAYTGTILATSTWYEFVYGIYVPADTIPMTDEGGIVTMKIRNSVDWAIESSTGLIEAERKEDSLYIDVKSHTFTKDTISTVTISDRSKKFRRTVTIIQSAYDELAKINTGIDVIHTNVSSAVVPHKGNIEIIVNCAQEWRVENRYKDFLNIKRKKDTLILKAGSQTRPVDLTLTFDIVTVDDGKVLRIPVLLQGSEHKD